MRKHNFSAGPAALPDAVLRQAQEEFRDWNNTGASVMEHSHRGEHFLQVATEAENDLRNLLDISDDYAVLFMHGGATAQFAAIPLNLLGTAKTANYLESGHWSRRAIKEAEIYCQPNIVAQLNNNKQGINLPPIAQWRIDDKAAYFHCVYNETIDGLELESFPDVNMPLLVDCSSNILSRPMPVERFSVIYAGAQKNIGPAGLAVVIIRRDLLDRAHPLTPSILNYGTVATAKSMHNTPPTFAWYLSGLVFKWLLAEGGLLAMQEKNKRNAASLYETIDSVDLYSNNLAKSVRSKMNIPFLLADERLNKPFLEQADENGLLGLKGHRSVGGMRASIYNAVPIESVQVLVAFMRTFAKEHG